MEKKLIWLYFISVIDPIAMMIGGPQLETQRMHSIPRDLVGAVCYARENVPAYRNLPAADDLRTLEDFQQLPLLGSDRLAQSPLDFRSGKAQIFRISSSGGTTGFTKTVFRTYEDHLLSSKVAAEMFSTSTVGSLDIVAILQPFDIWGIAFIALDALRFLGAAGLPLGSSVKNMQCLKWFSEFRPSVIYGTPSRISDIADLVSAKHASNQNWFPRVFLLAGEPVTDETRSKLTKVFGADVFSIYGSEETDGLAAECVGHCGLHLVERGILYELVDQDTLLPTNNNRGLLVVTPIGWRGTVLMRYVIGDLVELDFSLCPCGKPTARITNIQRGCEGIYLWDGLYTSESQITSAMQEVFGEQLVFQCVVKGSRPPQQLEILVDFPDGIVYEKGDNRMLRDAILKRNIDLANACMNGEVTVLVRRVIKNEFRRNTRGKISKFVKE